MYEPEAPYPYKWPDGAVATPGVAFSSDPDTGLYLISDGILGIATAGVERIGIQSSQIIFNEDGLDTDFRVESLNNANMLEVDAGLDSISIGGPGGIDGSVLSITPGTVTRTAITSVGNALHVPADTDNFDNASSTVALYSTQFLGIQTLTGDTATLTFTDAATLYIAGVPVASTNVAITNTPWGIWSVGAVRFDGGGQMTGTWSDLGSVTTIDINGGSIDGATVGAASASTGAFTTLDASGLVSIGGADDSDMTLGLRIDQGANDNQILSFASSDIVLGGSPVIGLDADIFSSWKKANATLGGLEHDIFAEDGALTQVYLLRIIGGTADTTKTTSGVGMMNVDFYEHDGGGNATDITADGNIFTLRARVGGSVLTKFLIDEDGDMLTVVAGGTFDDYDDGAILEAYDQVRSGNPGAMVKADFGRYAEVNESALVELGILGAPMREDPLMSLPQLCRVLTGAVRQQRTRIKSLESKMLTLEAG